MDNLDRAIIALNEMRGDIDTLKEEVAELKKETSVDEMMDKVVGKMKRIGVW